MSELNLQSQIVRNSDLVASDMDGDLVMMSIDHGRYYGVSGVGTRVWELIAQPVSIGSIAEVIEREFEVEAATCKSDVLEFARELLKHKVVQIC